MLPAYRNLIKSYVAITLIEIAHNSRRIANNHRAIGH